MLSSSGRVPTAPSSPPRRFAVAPTTPATRRSDTSSSSPTSSPPARARRAARERSLRHGLESEWRRLGQGAVPVLAWGRCNAATESNTPTAEQCDDGPGNSDAIADACRTDCGLPRCGDRIVDSTEECDDGNATNCDGCSANCLSETGLVCGDGIPEPTCSQPCTTMPTARSATGARRSARSSRSRAADRAAPTAASSGSSTIPATTPHRQGRPIPVEAALRRRRPAVRLRRRYAGRVHVPRSGVRQRVRNGRVRHRDSDCQLDGSSGRRPKQAATNPVLAAVRASFGTIPGAIVGPTISDICTEWLPVTLPLRGMPGAYTSSKIILKSRAKPYRETWTRTSCSSSVSPRRADHSAARGAGPRRPVFPFVPQRASGTVPSAF